MFSIVSVCLSVRLSARLLETLTKRSLLNFWKAGGVVQVTNVQNCAPHPLDQAFVGWQRYLLLNEDIA